MTEEIIEDVNAWKPETWFPVVYLAQAISLYKGEPAADHDGYGLRANARVAIQCAMALHQAHIATICPSLTSLPEVKSLGWDDAPLDSEAYDLILEVDKSLIAHADGLLVCSDAPSKGVQIEIAWARSRDKPVFYTVEDCIRYFREGRNVAMNDRPWYRPSVKYQRVKHPSKHVPVKVTATAMPADYEGSVDRSVKPGRRTVSVTELLKARRDH